MERAIKKIEFHIKHETQADHDRTQVKKYETMALKVRVFKVDVIEQINK